MAVAQTSPKRPITRRKFLRNSLIAAAGLAVYAGEIERHFIDVTRHDVQIPGLPAAFDGARIAQLSDIHLDEYSEPLFVEHAVNLVNQFNPDFVFLTGDFVTSGIAPNSFSIGAAWQCAGILRKLKCAQRYAILGNHDHLVSAIEVTHALSDNGIPVLFNACKAIERGASRLWLAGLDDALEGAPRPDLAIPPSIRGVANEPVILLCHAPDYADTLVAGGTGKYISLMLSGHTHGGQVRIPFLGAVNLPAMGQHYVEGWFRLGTMQLHVNRGLGTVGLPFRFNCPPEISVITLHTAPERNQAALHAGPPSSLL